VKRYLLRVAGKFAQVDDLVAVSFEFYPAFTDAKTRPLKGYYDSLTVFSIIAEWRLEANNVGGKLSLEKCFLRYIRERTQPRGNLETVKTAYYRGRAIAEDEIALLEAVANRGIAVPCIDQS
jgi:hypothetical protein